MEQIKNEVSNNEGTKDEGPKDEGPKDEQVKKKPSKPRCFHCKKKLKMTELNFRCKCNHTFCFQHLNPHSHNCSFNYLKERQLLIEQKNPKMCIQCIEVK